MATISSFWSNFNVTSIQSQSNLDWQLKKGEESGVFRSTVVLLREEPLSFLLYNVKKFLSGYHSYVLFSYASAAQTSKTVVYKPRTTAVESEYNLSLYERTVQLVELQTTKANLLLEIVRTNLPVGVELSVKHPDADDDRVRYLPDLQLREKRKELEELVKSAKRDPALSDFIKEAETLN